MSEIDSNNDGVIDSNDTQFADLRIWVDANSNAITDTGELKTLSELNIKSINLSYDTINKEDSQGNLITQTATYTLTDNTTRQIADAKFVVDNLYSQGTDIEELTPEIQALPDAKGYGNVYDLRQAMAKDIDGSLQGIVEDFVSETDDAIRNNLVDDILAEWTGNENIDPDTLRDRFSELKLSILEKFMGEAFKNTNNYVGPNATHYLTAAYDHLHKYVYAQLMLQTHLTDLFNLATIEENNVNVNPIISEIKNEISLNEVAGQQLLKEILTTIKGMDWEDTFDYSSFYDTFIPLGAEYIAIFDEAEKIGGYNLVSVEESQIGDYDEYVIGDDTDNTIHANGGFDQVDGLAGNDTLYGDDGYDDLNGGEGNDNLYGGSDNDNLLAGSGDDYLNGGTGNDFLDGSSGDDVYIYNNGDGLDTISETISQIDAQSSTDVLKFGEGITLEDLSFSASENNLIISLNGYTKHITILGQFSSDAPYGIEYIEFADGSFISAEEIKGLIEIRGSENADTLTGSSYNDTIYGYEGNDVISAKLGNDSIYGGDGNDDIEGNQGNDVIFGDAGNDTINAGADQDEIEGGLGNDYIEGGKGNDTYIFNIGDGQDIIYDYDTKIGNIDKISFGEGITENDLLFKAVNNDLEISIIGTSDKITIKAGLGNSVYRIEEIKFSDNSSLSYTEISQRLQSLGTSSNDSIIGSDHDEEIIGFEGNDNLQGKKGNDTYIYNIGDGNDTIIDTAGADKIKFGANISLNNLILSSNDEDLFISFNNSNDSITVESYFANSNNRIETIEFADESSIDYDYVVDNLKVLGSSGNDSLVGYSFSEILEGKEGNDSVSGGSGDDTYVFNIGDGQDIIEETSGTDKILFGEGITQSDLIFSSEEINNNNCLVIRLRNSEDKITVNSYFEDNGNKIERFEFADESYLTDSDVSNLLEIVGTTGDDTINGTSSSERITGFAGNDTVSAGAGNDYIDGSSGNDNLSGGSGTDTIDGGTGNDLLQGDGDNDYYIFKRGYGEDVINESGAGSTTGDRILFGSGIIQNDLIFSRETYNSQDSLIIRLADTTDKLVVQGYYVNDSRKVEYFELANGTVLTTTDVASLLTTAPDNNGTTINGTTGADLIYAGGGNDTISANNGNDIIFAGSGNDSVNAGSGNDTINGGSGDDTLNPGSGNDVFIYNVGDGQDTIDSSNSTSGYTKTLKFGSGITLDSTIFSAEMDGSNENMVIRFSDNSTDKITIKKGFSNTDKDVDSYEFSNGTTLSYGDISSSRIRNYGSSANDNITSTSEKETIYALAGDDTIYAEAGDDIIYGGSGNDSLYGYTGNDIIYGEEGNDSINAGVGNDTISGGVGNDNLDGYYGDDVYLYNLGDGQDIISSSNPAISGYTVKLKFGPGITPENTVFSASMVDGYEAMVITFTNSPNDKITIKKGFYLSYLDIDLYEFNNGPTLTYDDIKTNLIKNYGTESNDNLTCTSKNETIYMLAGDDVVSAQNGNDTIYGGDGNDTLNGNNGDDIIYGEAGNDTINAGSNDDTIIGGAGDDYIDGYSGSDVYLFALGDGNDTINNSSSTLYDNRKLKFGEGITPEDVIFAKEVIQGVDSMVISFRNSLNDKITIINGFVNNDKNINNYEFTNGITLTYSDILSKKYVCGGNETNDTITGTSGIDIISGMGGNDTLSGLAGNDTLYGDFGDDTISGGDGNDILDGGSGIDTLSGGTGDDIFIVDSSNDVVIESSAQGTDLIKASSSYVMSDNVENLILLGTENINATGNSLNNTITGNSGDNILDGEAGSDTLTGGSGNDIYVIDNVNDVITENANEGTDEVQTSFDYTLGSTFENLTLLGTSNANGTGNAFDNVITGNTGVNTLTGGAGNDIYITSNEDAIIENSNEGIDTIQSNTSFILGNNLENLTLIGSNNINGTGNELNNIIIGNVGANTLAGGSGNDTYYISTSDTIVENTNEGTDTAISDITFTITDNIENLTLIGTANINGTGNDSENVITGNAGRNTLYGLAGNDTIDGASGGDYLYGGTGDDTYIVDSYYDKVYEETDEGNDEIRTSVNYKLSQNVEKLTLTGSSHISGTGNILNNTIIGNTGNNVIDGKEGADTLIGGTGNDIYVIDNEDDIITENTNEGIDEVKTSIDYTLVSNVENLTLLGEDYLNGTGNSLDNEIIGNSSDNTLDGLTGVDTLVGNDGNDTYIVDDINDQVIENPFEGYDTVKSSVSYNLPDNVEDLELTGAENINATGNDKNNFITGNDGNNTLIGGTGNDILDGGIGNDAMIGGIDDDVYYSDNASDSIVENTNEGTDTVIATYTYTLSDNLENLELDGDSDINGTGNSSDNAIYGNDANNVLSGNGGNDILYGGSGADTLIGGNGNDTLIINSEDDVIIENTDEGTDTVQSYISYTLASNLENIELQGNENIDGTGNTLDNNLTGNIGNNILSGAEGNDILNGDIGNDTLIGGVGNDTYIFGYGFGQDIIQENDSSTVNIDKILFGEDIDLEDLSLSQEGQDLLLSINNTTDSINITDYFVSDDNKIEKLLFADQDEINLSSLIVQGTSLSDSLQAGASPTLISGLEGDDSITGSNFNDFINGASGADIMSGGIGDDVYLVDNESDAIIENTNEGTDTIRTSINYAVSNNVENAVLFGSNNLSITGNALNNLITVDATSIVNMTINGGSGNDILIGGIATDTLYGDAGNDYLNGGANADTLLGGSGNDTFVVDNVNDLVIENSSEGSDTVEANITYILTDNVENLTLTEYENINGTGNELNNTLIGNAGDNTIAGGSGDDIINGGWGYDYLIGGTGNDSYIFEYGIANDTIQENDATQGNSDKIRLIGDITSEDINFERSNNNLVMNLVYGDDSLTIQDYFVSDDNKVEKLELADNTQIDITSFFINGTTGNDTLNGTENSEIFFGFAGDDTICAGDDTICAGDGNDDIDGGSGSNTLYGQEGNDIYRVNSSDDIVIEEEVEGIDSVRSSISYTLTDNVEDLVLEGSYNLNGTGNDLSNWITGNSGNNTIIAYAGEDYLDGGAGSDTLIGGLGDDMYSIDNINDIVTESIDEGEDSVASTISYTLPDNVENLYLAGDQNIEAIGNTLDNKLYGNSGNNTLMGGSGNDYLDGSSGSDAMTGGVGDDTYAIDNENDIITENTNEGTDTIESQITYTLLDNFENLTLTGYEDINATGNSLDNMLSGNYGNNSLSGASGSDTYIFSLESGQDIIDNYDEDSSIDTIRFDSSVDKDDIAVWLNGDNLEVDYASSSNSDLLTVLSQTDSDSKVDKVELSNGYYLTDSDINQLIQDISAYASNNQISIDGVQDVKEDSTMLAMVSAAWHA